MNDRPLIVVFVVVILTAFAIIPSHAAASEEGVKERDHLPLVMAPGVNLGGGTKGRGFILGADFSFGVALLDGPLFLIGVHADALYSFGAGAFTYCVGPETVFTLIGLDFCYAGDVVGGEYRHGSKLRVVLNLWVVDVYFRWMHVFGEVENDNIGEFGVVLIVPLSYENRRWGFIRLFG